MTNNNQKNHPVLGPESGEKGVSVIICAYTEARWNDLCEAVASVNNQVLPPQEIILVIDHNDPLFQRASHFFLDEVVLENQEEQGLSGARNTGIAAAQGNIIAFMDEDAVAEPEWLQHLVETYADSRVMGVGGAIIPIWMKAHPDWFPDEFRWVVGCTYRGMPVQKAPIRNLIGANMSIRRKVFENVGGFRTGLGRVKTMPLGCEETELCIRAQQRWPASSFVFNPEARVHHRVPAQRGTLRYFASRCFSEGISKSTVSQLVGARDGLSSERQYMLHTLPEGIFEGLTSGFTGWRRAGAILLGLAITGMGYLRGMIWGRKSRLEALNGETPSGDRFVRNQGRAIAVTGHTPENAYDGNSPQVSTDLARPRILMVTPRFFPMVGGVENHVYEVARRLAGKNVEVTVLTTDPARHLPRYEEMEGFHVERVRAWPADADYYWAPGIYAVIRRGDWDLVHVQSYHTLVPPIAMLAAWRSKIPYVVTFHGGGHSSRFRNSVRNLQRILLRPLLGRAARLIAVARFEVEQYGRELNISRDRFAMIPNGCDLPVAPTNDVASTGTLIASVGRLERYKGHQRVIAAMPYILKERPDARLWIAGSGPYEPELRRLAQQLAVEEKVQIQAVPISDRQQMAAKLSKASLFVLLSDFETHPIAVLEAVSLGVPALVADNSGLSELGELGLASRIPLRKHGREISGLEVAQAILAQLDHPLKPPAVNLPTWEDCAEELFDLYLDIIGSSQGGSVAYSHADPVLSPDPGGN